MWLLTDVPVDASMQMNMMRMDSSLQKHISDMSKRGMQLVLTSLAAAVVLGQLT